MFSIVTIASIALPPAISWLIDTSSPRFTPEQFNLPLAAREVVSKRTEKTATFEIERGKFAQVSGIDQQSLPKCDSLLCSVVDSIRTILPAALATTAGPRSSVVAVDDNSYGTNTWTTPGNVTVTDNNYATVTWNLSPSNSHYINASQFGFSIPWNATINGVLVEIERKCNSSTTLNYCKDSVVRLVKNGSIQGDNKADTVTYWSVTEGYYSYGDLASMWGLALSASDVNSADFGAVLSCTVRGNA